MTCPTRRTLIAATGLTAAAALVSCTPADESGTTTTPKAKPDMTTDPSTDANVLLVFFSRAGENYWEGGRRNLDIGNTKVIAQMIQEQIDCDVFEILAVDPYPDAYDATVERNQSEQNEDARPIIDGDLPDLSGYDTIVLGSPVWNTRAPMILRTFIEQSDHLAGKTVRPFLTYAVGEGSVLSDYAEFCPDANITEGLAIRGEDATNAASDVEHWLKAHSSTE